MPTELKDVQKLASYIASLSRFICRLGKKTLPYRLLKKTKVFLWTDEVKGALEAIKQFLATNPTLTTPRDSEPVLLYISATNQVASVVLVVEREEEGHTHKV